MTQANLQITDEPSALVRKCGLVLGPLLFMATLFMAPPEGMSAHGWKACGLAMWMASWWISEAMPLPVTSLLPIAILPFFDILPLKKALAPYASPIIFLFLGGFIISFAMEKWNLHLRIGLGVLRAVGRGGYSVLAGMMLATAFMGMWISNTATMIMMLPIALSMSLLLSADEDDVHPERNHLARALILGVAYAAVIGGLGTFIGTPTNAVLYGYLEEHYGYHLSLAQWMTFGVPLLLFILAASWGLLSWMFIRHAWLKPDIRGSVSNAFTKLGPMQPGERRVLHVFLFTAGLWTFSGPLESALGIPFDDAVIAILGALLLFTLPLDRNAETFAFEWKDTAKLPWGILIFFGGALCVSEVLTSTGVTGWLSVKLSALHGLNLLIIIVAMVLLIVLISEMMSNVATITAFLPIMAALSASLEVNPLLIMVPATLAASCAFMLPGASAPNALAYGTGYFKVKDMVRPGLCLNIISALVIVAASFTIISYALGIEPSVIPVWAQK